MGGTYEVMHHTQFINALLKEGRIKVEGGSFKGKRITFHDPCYLGRGNGEYEAPREVLLKLDAALVEMKRSKPERPVLRCRWRADVQGGRARQQGSEHRTQRRGPWAPSPDIIAAGCPFCNTMLTDGVKHFNKEGEVVVKDIAELIAEAGDL